MKEGGGGGEERGGEERGGALRDIQKTAAKETKMSHAGFLFVLLLTTLPIDS